MQTKRVSAKTLAARARSDKLMLPAGSDSMARYFTGGAKVNEKKEGMATGPSTDLMKRENYVSGMSDPGVMQVGVGCVCGCGHRPGCTGFLAIASVGEAD
jgi:hypothetical protein